MVGLTGKLPASASEKDDLLAIYQLAEEVRERTEAANHQWHEEE